MTSEKTIESLKEKEVFYIQADNGNRVVIMYKTINKEKMQEVIDKQLYIGVEENPLEWMIGQVDEMRKEVKKVFGNYLGIQIKVSNPKLPYIYFSQKTHKPAEKVEVDAC